MEQIWKLLGLEPTRDVSEIRRAYAQKARICHPEEDPAGFLALRQAYQAALDYAEGAEETAPPPDEAPDVQEENWTLTGEPRIAEKGPNPFEDHEAFQNFRALYTGKQRKNPKMWLDYFTSGPFLDVMREPRFTALLLEEANRLEDEFPVNAEFLLWLYQAYQFTVTKLEREDEDGEKRLTLRFRPDLGAEFQGIEALFYLAAKGPIPKEPKGSERLVKSSFKDYGKLLRLAEAGVWSEQALSEAGRILDFYAAGNLTDGSACRAMDSERHPVGLRLIEHFFRRNDLPDELYRILWTRLSLKTAVMGRDKLLYGGLREHALERLPDVGEADMNFLQLNRDYERFRQTVLGLEKSGVPSDLARADAETKAFFARPEVQRALRNRRFVEEQLLRYWLNLKIQWGGEFFVRTIQTFYQDHSEAPCAEQVLERVREMRHTLEVRRWNQEDTAAPFTVSFRNRAFLRHWLHTAFHEARDPVSGRWLRDYLKEELPWIPEWSCGFLEAADGEAPEPKTVLCALGTDIIEVRLHLRYAGFLLNGTPIYRACLDWERTALADTETLLFLLPMTAAPYDQYEAVREELLGRLTDTAMPEEGRGFLASCLAERVCSLPTPGEAVPAPEWDEDGEPLTLRNLPPESVLPFEVYVEDGDHLYGCVWLERTETLTLFEQLPNGRQVMWNDWYEGIPDTESALTLAQQLLEDILTPPQIPMELLETLPDEVYGKPDYKTLCRNAEDDKNTPSLWLFPTELLGDSVTAEKLEILLNGFAQGRIERLELSWRSTIPVGEEQGYEPRRSLVFLKGGGGFACLYFDDFRAASYAVLEKPSLYHQTQEGLKSVPFRRGTLSAQVIHRKFITIQRHLGEIFQQVSWPNNVKYMAGGFWVCAVYVSHGRNKYNLDKQLLADFPLKRAHNRLDAIFYFSRYPDSAVWTNEQGGTEKLEVMERNRDRLQQILSRFIRGEYPKLRLTWEELDRRHIVLLHDGGRFLMAWIQEEKRSVRYHVAQIWDYMDVEGRKYPKDTFQGRTVPAYLIHENAIVLRNALDLLLASIENPDVITSPIAEYADEKPVKARSYETLWKELVGDTDSSLS